MRILHTSDWHIGRQFHNVSLLEDQSYVIDQIVEMVDQKKVDVVLIAGDIYDRSVPPAAAVELLDKTLNRICNDLQVPVIMIAGNHDSPERLGFGARQLSGGRLHIVGPLNGMLKPVVVTKDGQPYVFYGMPYADPARVRDQFGAEVSSHDQAMEYLCKRVSLHHLDNQYAAAPAIVLSHCFLDGGEGCESERPLSIGGADMVSANHFSNFSYAALGHLHGRQFKKQESIRYSGSILKYSFSEQHQHKSVVLVDMDHTGQTKIEQLSLHPRRDMRVIEGSLDEVLCQGADDPHADDYVMVRLSDTHAILDLIGKLRQVFPNVLHIERPGLMAKGEVQGLRRDQLKKSEMAMFTDFYQQLRGESLTAQQSQLMEQVLSGIHQQNGEQEGDS